MHTDTSDRRDGGGYFPGQINDSNYVEHGKKNISKIKLMNRIGCDKMYFMIIRSHHGKKRKSKWHGHFK